MHFSLFAIASTFAAITAAGPLAARAGGLPVICPGLKTMDSGCMRCKYLET